MLVRLLLNECCRLNFKVYNLLHSASDGVFSWRENFIRPTHLYTLHSAITHCKLSSQSARLFLFRLNYMFYDCDYISVHEYISVFCVPVISLPLLYLKVIYANEYVICDQ